MHEAGRRAALVVDEAVVIRIAPGLDPFQRALEVWPQLLDERLVAGVTEVRTGQHDEQRRRVDAAVVMAEGNLAERRHLAAPGLVQDLPRLRVALGRDFGGLLGREIAQYSTRQ